MRTPAGNGPGAEEEQAVETPEGHSPLEVIEDPEEELDEPVE
jgi:hypothetical protein